MSSYEDEYIAISFSTCELLWLTFLMKELNNTYFKLPVLYFDSQSEMHITSNPIFHELTKHLEIECHLVREKLQQGLLRLLPNSNHEQLADFLTKALPISTFNNLFPSLT